ncbi:hypothetical protein ACEYYB_03040 [Paracoccus sp. p4-l81]|uniref:hypothetical protein n=1 Tax=Paracoccus sp. p3-h83 TaxID=3342805 RepID=UPI0035BA931B
MAIIRPKLKQKLPGRCRKATGKQRFFNALTRPARSKTALPTMPQDLDGFCPVHGDMIFSTKGCRGQS